MAKEKTKCPRCGNANARPNARGPLAIYCKPCGGIVDVDPRDSNPVAYSNDPAHSAEAMERGLDRVGRILPNPTQRRGGL